MYNLKLLLYFCQETIPFFPTPPIPPASSIPLEEEALSVHRLYSKDDLATSEGKAIETW